MHIGCLGMLAAAGALAQTEVNWVAPAPWDGLYTEGSNWSTGAPLVSGEKGRFTQNGNYTITFPADFTHDVSMTEVNISNGKVTFDTRGTSWIKPTGPHLLSDHTFRLMNGGHSFNLEGTGNNLIQFGLVDAVLTVEAANNTIHTTLESGLFNIYDATGVDDSGARLVTSHDAARSHYVTWKEGSVSRIRQIDYRGKGPENIFRYEGGDHTVFGNFNVICQDVINGGSAQVLVFGGTLDVRNEFNVGQRRDMTAHLLIDGGEVRARQLRFCANDDGRVRGIGVMSNGTLSVTSGELSVAKGRGSESSFTLYGGEITVTGSNVIPGDQGTGTVEIVGGKLLQSSGEISIARNANAVGKLVLSGGSYLAANSDVYVAHNGASLSGELLVTGGDHLVRTITVGPSGGHGYAELAGGNVSAERLLVGNDGNSTNGFMRISGGHHTVRGNLDVGDRGLGSMEISGGQVDCYGYVRLGVGEAQYAAYDKDNLDTNKVSTLRMTGGVLRFLGTYPLNVADTGNVNGHPARLALDGGVVYAREIRGWNGAACKRGSSAYGYAELTADGGRVVPQNNNTMLLETFDLALLGDSGLTVDVAMLGYSTRIHQVFQPKPGTRGRLVKTGIGTLYLNGTSTIGDIVVDCGTLVVQAANVFTGNLVVTNGATLSLLESGGLTLEALTLGDASRTGRLMLDNNETVVITEAGGLNAVNAWVFLSGPAVNGAYTLFNCAGTVTLQDIEGLDLANGDIAKDYVWSVAANGSGTDVILTVSDRGIVTPVIWDGVSDSLWSVSANWQNGPPAKGQSAWFPEAAARKSITVTSGAAVGDLDFQSATGYTISGEPLTLDNAGRPSRVTVAQGMNQISAPLIFKRLSTFDLADGTTLTVDTLKGDGKLVKSGLGLAVLNGSDDFTGGFTVQAGTLALTSTDAFGMPSQESDRWTLAGGTLRYDSAAPVSSAGNSIALNAPAADGATVVDVVANDLVLNGTPNVSSGVLIKRGEGTLTFNVNGAGGALSASDGKVSGNGITPDFNVEFLENGTPPANGYSGFNVAEGVVRLTSPNASSLINIRNAVSIGLKTLQGTASPRLEINHCQVEQIKGSYHLFIGARTPAGSMLTNPALHVVNGAYLRTDTLQFGNNSEGPVNPELLIDASVVWNSYAVNVNQGNGGVTSITLTNKAEFIIHGNNLNLSRPANFVADDSLLQMNNTTDAGFINFGSDANGTFTLRNGSRMRYARVLMQPNAQVLLAFDNATLEPQVSDRVFAFRGDNTRQTVELSNQGVTFDIADELAYTIGRNMTGSGAFRKAGLGTLVFAGLLQETDIGGGVLEHTPLNAPIDDYTGGTWVDAGTLVVSNATIRTDRRITVAEDATLDLTDTVAVGTLAGVGTIVGGALTQGTLAPGLADGAMGSLSLDGTTLTGVTFACEVEQDLDKRILAGGKLLNVGAAANVIVDFGRTSLDPLLTPCSIPIGTYDTANPPPNTATWKIKGIGRSSTISEVIAQDGIITVNIRFGGTLLLIR